MVQHDRWSVHREHAHQDQGSFLLYKDGWLASDSNIFSHSGLAQDTTNHSIVRISQGGTNIRQVVGTHPTLEALQKGDGWLHVAADVTDAYNGNAAIQNVQRETVFLEPNTIVVFDRVTTTSGAAQTWQLVTPVQPSISGNTATVTSAGHTLAITKVTGGPMSTYDFRGNSDFSGGWRLDEAQAGGGDQRYLHVFSIDGAATNVAAAGDAAHPGVSMTVGGEDHDRDVRQGRGRGLADRQRYDDPARARRELRRPVAPRGRFPPCLGG